MIKGHISPQIRALAKQCATELDIKIQASIENQMRRELEAAEDAVIMAAYLDGSPPERFNLNALGLRFI